MTCKRHFDSKDSTTLIPFNDTVLTLALTVSCDMEEANNSTQVSKPKILFKDVKTQATYETCLYLPLTWRLYWFLSIISKYYATIPIIFRPKLINRGDPLRCSRWRIQHCHCSSSAAETHIHPWPGNFHMLWARPKEINKPVEILLLHFWRVFSNNYFYSFL